METIIPGKLKPGDTICVVSPASPLRGGEGYRRGKRTLEEAGYRVVEGKHMRERYLLFAGDDRARADDINGAFRDRTVDAIICVRGGTGTLRVLPYIDFKAIRRNPKIFVGYSDITALQLAMLRKTGLVTFYGPMVATDMGKGLTPYKKESLFRALTLTEGRIELKNPPGKRIITLYPGEVRGQMVGGCLSILVSTLGTKYEVDTREKILFFEDIGETPHRVDRYLTQLLLAGKLQAARGLIFGTFSESEYPVGHDYRKLGVTLLDIVKERVVPLRKPAVFGLHFGHVADTLTLPVGAYALLDATNRRVSIEPCVT